MEIRVLILVALFAVAVGVSAQVTSPSDQPASQIKDVRKLQVGAGLFARYQDALDRGDLRRALVILEEEIMPHFRGAYSLRVAGLRYEMGDYPGAAQAFAEFRRKQGNQRSEPIVEAMYQVLEILIDAGLAGRKPDWSALPNLSKEINPEEILVREVQTATVTGYLRTAELLLGELPKVGVDKERIAILKARLQKRKAEISARQRGT